MNLNNTKRLFLAGATALLAHSISAQTWQTVDDFQYIGSRSLNDAVCMTTDAGGNLYVAGFGYDASNVSHGIIMRSDDQGATWLPLDDFLYSTNREESYSAGRYNAIGFDAAQDLFAVATAPEGVTPKHLVIRKSVDFGLSWQTMLDLSYTGALATASSPGFAADSAGRIFVSCNRTQPGPMVLRSTDGGASWSGVNPFAFNASLNAILNTPAGLFVCGSGAVMNSVVWDNVRKSIDGGLTWTTVDTYTPPGFTVGTGGFATAMCADAAGNIYVAGSAVITTGKGRTATTALYCVIRKGTNGGTKWQTLAEILTPSNNTGANSLGMGFDAVGNFYLNGLAPGTHGTIESTDGGKAWNWVDAFPYNANSFTTDPSGNVYLCGTVLYGVLPGLGEHWIVRKLPAP
jgi:hypothetical protein